MRQDVLMPTLSDEAEEGVLVAWFVVPGAPVSADQLIAEVQVEKVSAEVYFPRGWSADGGPRPTRRSGPPGGADRRLGRRSHRCAPGAVRERAARNLPAAGLPIRAPAGARARGEPVGVDRQRARRPDR